MQSFSEFLNKGSQTATPTALPSFSDFLKTSPPIVSQPNLLKRISDKIAGFAPVKAAVDTSTEIFENLFRKGPELGQAIQEGVPQTVAKLGETGLAVANVAFSPLAVANAAAQQVPVLKQAADIINFPFEVFGMLGGVGGTLFTDALPISKESKDILKPVFKDMGSLAVQIYFGSKIIESIKNGEKSIKIKKIINETPDEYKIDIKKLKTVLVKNKTPDEVRINIQTPYIPENQLPTIQVGKTPKSELPTIQVGEPQIKPPPGLKYIPIKTEVPKISVPSELKPISFSDWQTIGAPPSMAKVSIPEAPTKITKAASDINANLVKLGFDNIPIGEQAKYTPTTKAEQMGKIVDLMDSNIEQAKLAAKGEVPVPNGILPQPLFNAIEEYALKNDDVQLLKDLAKSPVATQLSEAGQTLGTHGFNDNPNSVVKIIQDIQKSRESKADMVKSSKLVDETVKTEVKKAASTRPSWAEFIKSIECGY